MKKIFLVTFMLFLLADYGLCMSQLIAIKSGKLIIADNSYKIKELLDAKSSAYLHADWIAISSLPNGWGPNGGNVFLEISEDRNIKYKEIYHPWSNDKKLLLEFQGKLPNPKSSKNVNITYSVIGYNNYKLWYALFLIDTDEVLGDWSPPPDIVGYADIKKRIFVFYDAESFSEKAIPYIRKCMYIDNHFFLIGYKKLNVNITAIKNGAPEYFDPVIFVLNKSLNKFEIVKEY